MESKGLQPELRPHHCMPDTGVGILRISVGIVSLSRAKLERPTLLAEAVRLMNVRACVCPAFISYYCDDLPFSHLEVTDSPGGQLYRRASDIIGGSPA